jgi:WD40 repeat protein
VSPDGETLAAGCWNSDLYLWNPSNGQQTGVLNGHTDHVNAVLTSPFGKLVFSGSADATTRIWNLESGKELCRLISLDKGWVVVTPDGYFDGSPEGIRGIRWTVGLESYPLEAFSEGYYVPGLLGRILSGREMPTVKSPSLCQGFLCMPDFLFRLFGVREAT